ncbi:MAG: hypothetical protein KAU36_03740, partial [candidate division Zixibacteria bacterium]|nr:hypothetical protein [candidate division Zixibacteria bacterium]
MSLNRVLYYSALTVALLCLAPAAGNAGTQMCAPVGTIQATATVIHPLGLTAPGDDFLTTRPVERRVYQQESGPLEADQWL